MRTTLWKESSKRNNAQELIDFLLSARNSDGSWNVNILNDMAFAELVSSSPYYPTLPEGFAMRVLGEMSNRNIRTVDDFELIFEQFKKSEIINSSNDDWKFFIPLEIAISTDVPRPVRVTVLGKNFSFLSLESAERQLDKKTREDLKTHSSLMIKTKMRAKRPPKILLSVADRASDWKMAWKNVEPAFDALRGTIELTLDLGGWQISSGRPSPRRKLSHPRWMIAQKVGGGVEWVNFITDEDDSDKPFELSANLYDVIRKNCKVLSREPKANSTLSIVADCLRLYSQAMDARFKHDCFLGFWQLAEAITRSESVRGETKQVISRMAWHSKGLGLKGSGYKETLAVLANKRNDIVHRGLREVDDRDINILKTACESALLWLFDSRKSLPTVAHLEQFYRLRETNVADLEALRDSVTFIKKHREKK